MQSSANCFGRSREEHLILLTHGYDIKTIEELLRHRSVKTTMIRTQKKVRTFNFKKESPHSGFSYTAINK